MPITSIARRLIGGGGRAARRPAPRTPGAAGGSTDAQIGRGVRKGLRRLLR